MAAPRNPVRILRFADVLRGLSDLREQVERVLARHPVRKAESKQLAKSA